MPTPVVLDFLLVALLIASPFLFGFSGDGTATAFFIVLLSRHFASHWILSWKSNIFGR